RPEMAESRPSGSTTARARQNSTRWRSPSLGNDRLPRSGEFHRSGIAESHAVESSIAREWQNLTRWSDPSLGDCVISRAVEVHRSKIAYSHELSFIFYFQLLGFKQI